MLERAVAVPGLVKVQTGSSGMEDFSIVVVPGFWNSGTQHWQTLWHDGNPSWIRLEQDYWDYAEVGQWGRRLEETVGAADRPVVIVAHSLSCVLTAFWAPRAGARVAGAMLVAPSDPDGPVFPLGAVGFSPVPMTKLPFPTLVVASRNDVYVEFGRAAEFAAAWGGELIDAGPAGHINADSGHGPWSEGRQLLDRFCERLRASLRPA